MKKTLISLLFLLILIFSISSCKKTSESEESSSCEASMQEHVSFSSEALSSFEESIQYEDVSVEHTHLFGEWETVVSATCQSKGEQNRTCIDCGFIESGETDVIPHSEELIPSKEPTCTEEGITEGKICITCGTILKEQFPISKKEHSYSEETIIDSTCSEKGYTVYKCICGESYKDNYKLLSAHVYKETVVSPSCEKEGYTLYECTTCNDSYKDNFTIGSHDYSSEVVPATCESKGYTLHKCKLCKSSYKDSETKKLEHNYEKNVVLPTVCEQGYTKYICSLCKNSYKENYTDYNSICQNAYSNNKEVLAMGIDVSKWNHRKDSSGNYLPLDWVSIKKAGVDFVILKAGSTKGADPVFEMNYKGAKEAGLDVGAYYYTYALNPEEATKDAEDFISLIKGKKFEYPLYMDFEDSSQRNIPSKTKTEMIKNFASTLQKSGYYAGIYTGYYWMNPRFDILEADVIIDMLDLWFAHIDSAESVSVDTVYKWSSENNLGHAEFGMWQYAHKGVFDFINNEYFDFNYAYKDYPSIIKKLGLNGYEDYVPQTEYVWVKVKNLNVRSYWDTSVSDNVVAIAHKGDKFEIIEKTKEYVKINYNGIPAYISGDNEHISFTEV